MKEIAYGAAFDPGERVAEREERTDRLAGIQRFPARVYFPDATSLQAYLGKAREVVRFVQDVGLLTDAFPGLRVVEQAGDLERIVAVLRWLAAHPRPLIFLRGVPAVEDTKFIGGKKAVLRELLDLVLVGEAVDRQEAGFEGRYGLRKAEPLVRVRILDADIARTRLSGLTDLTVPASDLDRLLFPELPKVIIFENKANFSNADAFLSLPNIRGCAGIFGSGFAVGAVRSKAALSDRRLFYRGDIDTQDLRILALVRRRFSDCRSVLMDEETFDLFPEYRTGAPRDTAEEPQGLDEDKRALFRRPAALPRGNRLEQERIPLRRARERLASALD